MSIVSILFISVAVVNGGFVAVVLLFFAGFLLCFGWFLWHSIRSNEVTIKVDAGSIEYIQIGTLTKKSISASLTSISTFKGGHRKPIWWRE